MNSQSDYPTLEKTATENKVEILGNAGGMELWYQLACDKSSTTDALSMANKFQESGLFEYAQADNFGNRYYDPLFDHTSAACPQVAATAASILSVNPNLSCQEVARYIGSTATKINTNKYFYDAITMKTTIFYIQVLGMTK